MPVVVASNISSLRAQRSLDSVSRSLESVFQRLSTGQRINSASDDAAGLAISESLRADTRVYTTGVRNLNDGISALSIADSATEQLSTIVIRIRELAEQSANGTFNAQQRKAIDEEAQALSKEYSRIQQTTRFNGLNLFDGTVNTLNLQGGYGTDGVVSSGFGGRLGTGTFSAAATYTSSVLSSGYDMDSGDVNGDGNLDVTIASRTINILGGTESCVELRLGRGDGTFSSGTTLMQPGSDSLAVTLEDSSGDGVLDLAVGTYVGSESWVTVSLGNGDGTFRSSSSYLAGDIVSRQVTFGDLNGDGLPDMVVTGDRNGGCYASVRLGTGSGAFGTAITYATEGRYSYEAKLGDLNGDNILDLVTCGSDNSDAEMNIRLGRGDGTFGSALNIKDTIAFNNCAVSLSDINGDSRLDLVSATGDQRLLTRLGNGDGTFKSPIATSIDSDVQSLFVADLNGDSRLDAIMGGAYTLQGFVEICLGNGDGTFAARKSYKSAQSYNAAAALGDFNNDGVFDLATAGVFRMGGPYTDVMSVFMGQTRGGVAPLLPFSLKTIADSRGAMSLMDQKLSQLASQRGTIGAFQSRLGVAINTLKISSENYTAADSRLRDSDIAVESASLVRLQILQQAASSVLSHANQQPALALQLLGT